MKNFLSVAFILVAMILIGCGGEQSKTEKQQINEPPIQKITRAEADIKLKELSAGLDVRVDDMKELTFYYCRINHDIHPSIYIIPYVVVDKEYQFSLHQDILYIGHEPLYFDKLYIKTSSGVETFHYEKTVRSFDKGYVGEEYVGLMTDNL